MHDFRRLEVWQRSVALVASADVALRRFPPTDRGVIGAQLRRALISIPANIAEGCGRNSRAETIRFLRIASGSATEAESHLEVAGVLGYLAAPQREALLGDVKAVQRMLFRLIQNFP